MASSPTCKPWFKSKTVWFNILTIGGAVVDGFLGLMPMAQSLLAPEVYPFVMLAVGTVNVALRAITTGPIDWKSDV